mmetsp:Transcript_52225/g.118828  ORF Transcript_52225/g.118828 Transcript_52225/m.118828 type:complete len:618 (-) Transcript_52225:16-1869(-)
MRFLLVLLLCVVTSRPRSEVPTGYRLIRVAPAADAGAISVSTPLVPGKVGPVHARKLLLHGQTVLHARAEQSMPPSVLCVVTLTVSYLLVYLFFEIARTVHQFTGDHVAVLKVLEHAAQTVDLAPMVAVLFLAVRLRAGQLGSEPNWFTVQMMILATCGVVGCALVALVVPALTGEFHKQPPKEPTGEGLLKASPKSKTSLAASCCGEQGSTVLRKVGGQLELCLVFLVYLGSACVIIAAYSMKSTPGNAACPDCTWEYTPPVSPAVECAFNVCVQFFLIYTIHMIVKFYNRVKPMPEFAPGQQPESRTTAFEIVCNRVKETVDVAPMVVLLFIGARLRALQLDPNGAPQPWAQQMFYLATFSLLALITLGYITPVFSGEIYSTVDSEGNLELGREMSEAGRGLTALKFLVLLVFYCSVAAVMFSVFTIEAPAGMDTPPVSTAMTSAMVLTCVYLGYFMTRVSVLAYDQLSNKGEPCQLSEVLTEGMSALRLMPMLCVLFICCRMRATMLMMADPPEQAQTGMILATLCILGVLAVAVTMPWLSPAALADYADYNEEELEMFKNGSEKAAVDQVKIQRLMQSNSHTALLSGLTITRYVFLAAVYAGVGLVMYHLFAM